MLRIFLLVIANFSLVYTDFSSNNMIKAMLLPLIDLAFAIYLFWQISIFVIDNINNLTDGIHNRFADPNWQTPRYFLQYAVEFVLWCVTFAQYMILFKKAILT